MYCWFTANSKPIKLVHINGKQYIKIIQSNVGDQHQSQIFKITNLKWRIDCYPNGQNEKEKDSK